MWGAIAAVTLLVLFLAFMRQDAGPATTVTRNSDDPAVADAELLRHLRATLVGLRPENLNVSVDIQGVTGDLNLWWADYTQRTPPATPTDSAAVNNWLGDAAAENAAFARFRPRDAAHIRNAQLYRAIASSLAAGGQSQRELVAAAFDLVTRHMTLVPSFASQVPLGSFEVLLAGRGTADDRIWVFAEILRQLSIDCVVLEPKTPAADAAMPQKLVGAIIPEGIVLFDPQLGLPIPPVGDTEGPLPTGTVLLREAQQDDAVLRQFDVPGGPAYPWTAAALADLSVRFIIDSTYASPRMLTLQTALPSEHTALLYDGPALSDDSPSLEDRVKSAGKEGGWSPESVAAWQYPEQQLTAFYAAGGEAAPAADQVLGNLRGPYVPEVRIVDGREQVVSVPSRRPLRIVRIQHLRGETLEALMGYVEVRSALLEAGNAAIREDAVHWVAVCQEELERYDAAVSTLELSLRHYPNGLWAAPARSALARCEALRGNYDQAVQRSPAPSADELPNLADAYLLRRWQSRANTPAPASSGR